MVAENGSLNDFIKHEVPPKVVVIIRNGRIQNIATDGPIEAYVVDCDLNAAENGATLIGGVHVMLSKHGHVIEPRFVNKIVSAIPACL